MDLDAVTAYRALTARDARFDGRLYVGVTSTGIYCRPICRVRTPRRENCRFFASAAQAEAAAFRPCLKCRPEIAPGPGLAWSVMDASRTLAMQAAAQLDANVAQGDATDLATIAARLGISDRHLRRIFRAAQGVTPMRYLQTRRLLLAKQLLTDTALPVAQIALHAGFRSLRRFNSAFAERYRMSPSRLRGRAADASDARGGTGAEPPALMLAYRDPYDHAALLRFLARRAIPGVEAIDGLAIRRTVRAGALTPAPGWVEARFVPGRARVQLRIVVELLPAAGRLVAAARRWLDLDASTDVIDAALAELPGSPGLRLPGSLDDFELAVRAVLGQQITVAAARTLGRRLVERYGIPLATPWPDLDRTFPAPGDLAAAGAGAIAALGIVGQRAAAIVALAEKWPDLERRLVPGGDPQALIEALVALPGIGPWTAHYIAMRTLGWPDAFPPGDVAALKAMRERFGPLTPGAALARAQAWRPWRGYALLRLWNTLERPR
jgi:AraC family transcriptional regulator, regulatory protein of adaptative response / DNA-3-methyladenine glycosylase II